MNKKYIPLEVAITAMTADNLLAHFDSVEDVIENRFHRAAERILASIPVADVLEVVRCRDCFYWEPASPPRTYGNCYRAFDIPAEATDFCSYGKRKDGPANEDGGCGRCDHCRINETGTCRHAEG